MRGILVVTSISIISFLFFVYLANRSWELQNLRNEVDEWNFKNYTIRGISIPELPPHNVMLWQLWRPVKSFMPNAMRLERESTNG